MPILLGIVAVIFLLYEAYVAESGVSQSGGFGLQSPLSIYQYALNAGFSGGDLITAVAIALAESGVGGIVGNADAYNPEILARGGTPEGQGSYGLWQIYLRDHPEFSGENLFDPQVNANAAFSIYRAAGNSFLPWATFKSLSQENIDTAASVASSTAGQPDSFSAAVGGW